MLHSNNSASMTLAFTQRARASLPAADTFAREAGGAVGTRLSDLGSGAGAHARDCGRHCRASERTAAHSASPPFACGLLTRALGSLASATLSIRTCTIDGSASVETSPSEPDSLHAILRRICSGAAHQRRGWEAGR